MFAYISRVISDVSYTRLTDTFKREMLYDWGAIIWDAVPITLLLIFHFKNFKPHHHELIIRM